MEQNLFMGNEKSIETKKPIQMNRLLLLVAGTGLEPATFGL